MNLSARFQAPTTKTEQAVRDLADEYGMTAGREFLDDWTDQISSLSGEDGEPADEVEQLIIALGRAGVIEEAQAVEIQLQYMREKLKYQ